MTSPSTLTPQSIQRWVRNDDDETEEEKSLKALLYEATTKEAPTDPSIENRQAEVPLGGATLTGLVDVCPKGRNPP